jgi:hypothetical protein
MRSISRITIVSIPQLTGLNRTSNAHADKRKPPKKGGRPVSNRTPALMLWLFPYGQQLMAASQQASTRSQHDMAKEATSSGAAALRRSWNQAARLR